MTDKPDAVWFMARDDVGALVDSLRRQHDRVLGPVLRDDTITMGELNSADELPRGWTLDQAPGRVRLQRRDDERLFGFSVGPESAKRQVFPAQEPIYTAQRGEDGKLRFKAVEPQVESTAVLGARACDLAAMDVQARVFDTGPHTEPRTAARREAMSVVAVQCTHPSSLCFCVSTGTGPRVTSGASVVATELSDGLLLRAADDAGEQLLSGLPLVAATPEQLEEENTSLDDAEASMGRQLECEGLPQRLVAKLDDSAWEAIGERCMACGNCTSVCPTCFCSTTEAGSGLSAETATHERRWESCFTSAHAQVHGGSFRPAVADRYRQWLMHKLGTWEEQFGVGGCVGCGRCIAWCPVGIDLVQEANQLVADTARQSSPPSLWKPAAEARVEDQCPRPAEVLAVKQETADVWTLHLQPEVDAPPEPGQFYMLGLPGIGESAVSVCGIGQSAVAHSIRAVGAVTRALCALKPGDELGLRGPYGAPWPMDTVAGKPLVLIAGGLGMAPLRPALHAALDRPKDFGSVHVMYGARSPEDQLYTQEMLQASSRASFRATLSVDRAGPEYRGVVGPVTRLMNDEALPLEASYFVCGPEIMMRFVVRRLRARGVPDEQVWVSLERHMKCAAGFCGRCQLGPHFVCKDGPVFRYDTVSRLLDLEGV